MFNVVIFGAPGSGKGTQSDKIVEKYDLIHLSTGDILRAEIAKGSEVGKIADGLISKGQFVPDDVIIKVLENAINEHPTAKGFIFDGITLKSADNNNEQIININSDIPVGSYKIQTWIRAAIPKTNGMTVVESNPLEQTFIR